MNKPAFKRIKYIDFNEIQLDAPVDIMKGALILDNKHERLLLQLKLANTSSYKISSVYISVDSYDDANDKIHNVEVVEHAYLDLNANPKEVFGEKNPVFVNDRTRNAEVTITKVVFSNGQVWRNESSEIYNKPKQKELTILDGSLLTYLKQKVKSNGYDHESVKYFPEADNDLWLCTCGRPNKASNNVCVRCGMNKKFIFTYTDEHILRNDYSIYVARLAQETEEENRRKLEIEKEKIIEEQIDRQKRIDEEQEIIMNIKARNNKIKKIIIIASSIILFLSIPLYLFTTQTKLGSYIYANVLYQTNNYTKAINIYEELDGYKYSVDNIIISKYQLAKNEQENNNLSAALKQFTEIRNYNDSEDRINKIQIELGLEYYRNNDYQKAVEYFENSEIENESESIKKSIGESFYILAQQKYELKKYDEASLIISKARNVLKTNIKTYPNLNELSEKIAGEIALEKRDENYDQTIQFYNNGDYAEVFNRLAGQVNYYSYYHYDWDSLNDFRDAKKYFIAAKIKSLIEEYKNYDIMEYDHGTNQYALKTLYESGKRIASFDNIAVDLNNKVFKSIWLEGRFTSGDLYFEYTINEDGNYTTSYNLPWYSGEFYRLIDSGNILQLGDEGSWRDTFKFNFSEDKETLLVYSYKDNKTYTLYRIY